MNDSLSIRSYSKNIDRHCHAYYQLVLPLNGYIDMEVGDFVGKVGVGEGIVILKHQEHGFRAHEKSRFIVADLSSLPDKLLCGDKPKIRLDQAIMAYLQYIECQLTHETSPLIEKHIVSLFYQLLGQHTLMAQIERRIEPAIDRIHQDPSAALSVNSLASLACLGPTQFKKLFRQSTGKSLRQYLLDLRMKKAHSLLVHTDMPVTLVSLEVGYTDVSAFSRRFTLYFGRSPKHFSNTR